MKPLRIGFCGPQGAGKSTTVDVISRELSRLHWSDFRLHAIDSVYRGVATMLEVSREALESASLKDEPWTEANAPVPALAGRSPRNVIDSIAGYLRLEFGSSVLAELWDRRSLALGVDVVFNDAVRFPCELEHLDVVIELTRTGVAYDGTKYNSRLPDYCIDFTHSLDDPEAVRWLVHSILVWRERLECGEPVLAAVEDEA